MAITGTFLVIGEPDRSLRNPAFWIKMALIAIAVALTIVFANSLRRRADGEKELTHRIRRLAAVTLFVWCAIAVAGRWIAYVDTD